MPFVISVDHIDYDASDEKAMTSCLEAKRTRDEVHDTAGET